MEYVHFVLGLVMVLALSLLANRHNWKQIKLRYIGQLLVVELALAWFMLNSEVGLAVVGGLRGRLHQVDGVCQTGYRLRVRWSG